LVVLIAAALPELRRLLSSGNRTVPPGLIPVLCLCCLLVPHVTAGARVDADGRLTVALLIVGLIGPFLWLMRRRTTAGVMSSLSTTLFAIVYLGLLPAFILRIRLGPAAGGAWLLLYFIMVVKVSDIGAYFTGRSFGRHKLIEWLSPKKTVEGLGGGIATSIVVAVATAAVVRHFGPPGLHEVFPPPGTAALFGLLMALFGTAGDLLESLIKRDAGVKDSARAVPAFGGVLDILDSLLLTAPIAFWMLVEWR